MAHEANAGRLRPWATDHPSAGDGAAADRLLPLLDDGLARLGEADRTAVVERFLRGKSFAEVADAVGSTEEAARKRVVRAVEKLRRFFANHGVVTGAGGVAVVLASQQAGPAVGMSQRVLITMAMAKLTTGAAVAVVALLLVGTGVAWVWHAWAHGSDPTAPPAVAATTSPAGPARTAGNTPAAAAAAPPGVPPPLQPVNLPELEDLPKAARLVSALCVDGRNQLWVGTKTDGVWRYDPYATAGEQWTAFDGPGTVGPVSVSAIGVDRRGRVWVGLESGGVDVFDGEQWQAYDVVGGADGRRSVAGPLGGHVAAVRVCPTDGAVWLATDAGVTRFDDATGRWTYFTRTDGLPSDAAVAIAFDPAGDAFVGTATDGIGMADAADGYRHWRTVTGPTEPTTTATGDGLPIAYVNDLATTPAGIVYAATTDGLAWSADRGRSWRYQHGRTWVDRLAARPEGLPDDWAEPPAFELTGDVIARLATDRQGHLYAAYAAGGVQQFTCRPDGSPVAAPGFYGRRDQVRALPPDMTRFAVGGGMGRGLVPFMAAMLLEDDQPPAGRPGLPPAAAPPTAEGLTAVLPVAPASQPAGGPAVVTLDDDWRTQGTWLGRYGRDWVFLNGMADPQGYAWGAGDQPTHVRPYLGPQDGGNGYPWYFIETLYDDQLRYLEIPPVYMDSRLRQGLTTPDKDRRMAEMNDGDHVRKSSYFGPGLNYDLSVPTGAFVLSMYLVNNDGRHAGTAERDYSVEVRLGQGTHDAPVAGPPVAWARAADFDGGVWKRFYVRGPADVSVRLQKLTIPSIKWSAVALDHPTDVPGPYFSWQAVPPLAADTPAGRLAAALRSGPAANPAWWTAEQTRASVLLARWCAAQPPSDQTTLQAAVADYHARLFGPCEAAQAALKLRPARDVERSLTWDKAYPDNSGFEARDLSLYVESLKAAKPR